MGDFVHIFQLRIDFMHAPRQTRTYILLPDVFNTCTIETS
jgi:hypothetical protein